MTSILLALTCAAVLAQTPSATFDSNGVPIRYASAGEGEAIVLIHGWMSDATMWGRDPSGEPKLTPVDGFRVIALDCRGHGKSGKPQDPNAYGAEMAADVVRLLDHLKIKRAHLVGYSMGAFLAAKAVATHPERVISVVYGGQAPLLTGEAGSREIDVFAKAVEHGTGLGPYLIEFAPPFRKSTLSQANAMADIFFKGKDVKAFALAGKSFAGLEVKREDLVKARIPTLFLYGEKEGEGTRARIAALRAALSAEEKVLPGVDHSTALIHREFGASLVQFVRKHRLTREADQGEVRAKARL